MDAYDIAGACHEIVAFIDALNNWYIRRSRDRFWAPGSVADGTLTDDKRDAYDTLFTVLTTLLKLAAPLVPSSVTSPSTASQAPVTSSLKRFSLWLRTIPSQRLPDALP
jgi:isoleucyl-tRNA synthetase